uniref:Uncharacterized protein n=1 Tax=Bionectria ochroleuca TaxID=29856 RepID=A0A8H7NP47_BIOOC
MSFSDKIQVTVTTITVIFTEKHCLLAFATSNPSFTNTTIFLVAMAHQHPSNSQYESRTQTEVGAKTLLAIHRPRRSQKGGTTPSPGGKRGDGRADIDADYTVIFVLSAGKAKPNPVQLSTEQ